MSFHIWYIFSHFFSPFTEGFTNIFALFWVSYFRRFIFSYPLMSYQGSHFHTVFNLCKITRLSLVLIIILYFGFLIVLFLVSEIVPTSSIIVVLQYENALVIIILNFNFRVSPRLETAIIIQVHHHRRKQRNGSKRTRKLLTFKKSKRPK